jgi:hypothetical protein
MSDVDPEAFGDFTEDDSFDSDPPDPEAVARIFLLTERQVTGDDNRPELDELHPWERAMLVFAFAVLLARLRREGGI